MEREGFEIYLIRRVPFTWKEGIKTTKKKIFSMKIASMANVEVPAILALESMGFTLASQIVNANQEMVWTASGRGNDYVAEDPLSLLGLVKLHEVRGDNWKASDDEIDKYLPMLEGDV